MNWGGQQHSRNQEAGGVGGVTMEWSGELGGLNPPNPPVNSNPVHKHSCQCLFTKCCFWSGKIGPSFWPLSNSLHWNWLFNCSRDGLIQVSLTYYVLPVELYEFYRMQCYIVIIRFSHIKNVLRILFFWFIWTSAVRVFSFFFQIFNTNFILCRVVFKLCFY